MKNKEINCSTHNKNYNSENVTEFCKDCNYILKSVLEQMNNIIDNKIVKK